jgi:hypothetical protein
MSKQELEDKAEAGGWNPYYFAYAIETGVSSPDEAFKKDGSNFGFMQWNTKRWSETCNRLGIDFRHAGHPRYVTDHLETLAARIDAQEAQ